MSSPRLSGKALLLAAMLGWSTPANAADPTITITYPSGSLVQAELADTPQKRAQGLMFRRRLAPDAGMLFKFESTGVWSFWMKNTHVALDILWIGRDKRIADMKESVQPCRQDPCLSYTPSAAALYALELPAGSVKREHLAIGMTLKFDGF